MPVKLEILSLIPITFKQCPHCERLYDQSGIGQQVHDRILGKYPKELLEDHHRLSALVVELINRYDQEIAIHVIDPQSLPGIWKSLRYRISRYPTFIIDNQDIIIGWNRMALDQALEARFSTHKPYS